VQDDGNLPSLFALANNLTDATQYAFSFFLFALSSVEDFCADTELPLLSYSLGGFSSHQEKSDGPCTPLTSVPSVPFSDFIEGAVTEPLLDAALLIKRDAEAGVAASGVTTGESVGPSASKRLFRFRGLIVFAERGTSTSRAARTDTRVSRLRMRSSGSSLSIRDSSSTSFTPSRCSFSSSSSLTSCAEAVYAISG